MLKRSEKKGKYKYLIIILVICALIGVAAAYTYNQVQERKFQKTADRFIGILEDKDYKELSSILDRDSYKLQDYTPKEIEQKYDSIFNGIGATDIHASKVELKKLTGLKFELKYQLSFNTPIGKIKNLNYKTSLVNHDDHILVEWKPSLIFPGMEGQDKVKFQTWKAERGEIRDRLDNELAVNADFKLAGIIPNKLGSGDERKKSLQKISRYLKIPTDDLEKKLKQKWVKDELFVPVKTITEKQAKELKGIEYQDTKQRYYPLKEAAAHLTGYVGNVTKEDIDKHPELGDGDVIGKAGLERVFDKKLRGTDGGEIVVVDRDGEEKQVLLKKKKVDGADIELTIDNYIQKEAFDSLEGNAGSTVVMNPKEGGLYALVSSPSYDPNKMAQGISQDDYDKYANAEKKPFISRFSVRYAPGSTFKTITASIGLDIHVTTPDKHREIHGLSWQKDKSWGGYSVTRVSDVKDVDMEKALIYSDNIYFAQEALEMGEKTFRKGLDKFIFGEELNLPFDMNPAQISNKSNFSSDILLADTGYGQGELLISPIQQIAMYSVFQNGGNIVYPSIEKASTVKKKKGVITNYAANEVTKSLEKVVTDPHGTAHSLNASNKHLAAKTGTAELKAQQGKSGAENSFLMAFDTKEDHFLLVSLAENYQKGRSALQLNENFINDLYDYLNNK
ncbi:penicillin-binding transpeptidase domain-containing protein [Aciduricibacillus chroicocephali]|uniref:serine-type D-Ala-D-Ala carboxypeptidase n=1 Tax=Aciduricibacillus chroicocephali TaxID=3054939 RepID=A0ABY9KSK0_9BACI|nr:penicillin-binding transpeptidase domain-containing protein [Bacillaceae bacterium 44XB]